MFDLVDGELILEDKIFIDNKPRAEDGESIALKINNQEFGESKFLFDFIDNIHEYDI